ncbi:UvrD-helicase domain-containing protein [Mesorhizobium sp. ASY16-5R]|uniref:UvrD-helicase domain-containing protein n=1 Tax=Mesorhizobium sp. ASY16-5R TaxID=3445772 RepID=UPI003F9EF2E7
MAELLITQKPTFLSELLALPAKESHQVQEKLAALTKDPRPDGKVRKQLKGWSPTLYRLRSGNYRIFYTFDDRYISLLALRRRSEDTYDEEIEAEDLGGFDPGDPRPVPQVNWEDMLAANQPKATPLPRPIDKTLLERLRVPVQLSGPLLEVTSREALLGCSSVPDDYLLQIDEVLFERPLEEVLEQPDLISGSVDDLFRFKEGDLVGFLLKLSPEQQQLISLNLGHAGPVLVKGGPGSGKSTVALYRSAKHVARLPPGSRVLFTTYTNALVAVSRGLLKTLLGSRADAVEVMTADAIVGGVLAKARIVFRPASQEQLLTAVRQAREAGMFGSNAFERLRSKERIGHLTDDYLIDEITAVIEARGLSSLESYLRFPRTGREEPLDPEQRWSIWQIKSAFESRLKEHGVQTWSQARSTAAQKVGSAPPARIYDAIVIDEAQDLEPTVLLVLRSLLKEGGEIFVTADANQSIYGSSFRWSDAHQDLHVEGKIGLLTANFRSTREISLAAASYLKNAAIDQDAVDQTFVHEGPLPALRRVRTPKQEIELLVRFVDGASRQLRLAKGSSAILCPSAREGERIADELSAHGLHATFMLSKDLDVEAPGVKVLPLRSAKGLEFPIVALAGFWPPYPSMPANAGKREREERLLLERRALFVGMTRAMRALLVIVPDTLSSTLFAGFDGTLWNMSA